MQNATTSTVVRWEFMRGTERLICQVDHVQDHRLGGAFAVVILPYRGVQRASVETYKAFVSALRRHASLATGLRATGWKLVEYTT